MDKNTRIYVAGHTGMVGSAIRRCLEATGHTRLITRSHGDLDLTRQGLVEAFFREERPEIVFLAAAKVGGILANATFGGDFIRENLLIQTHVLDAAHRAGVKKLLFVGSSCIYPRNAPQPIREADLMTGPLEPTNAPYATAKIAGVEMCRAYNRQYGTRFIPVMPTNLFGPGDNFDLNTSHVLPAMIRKCRLAVLAGQGRVSEIEKDIRRFGPVPGDVLDALGLEIRDGKPAGPVKEPMVSLWGTGRPLREFLHVDDLARGCVFLMNAEIGDDPDALFNIGAGKDISISELAGLVARSTGYDGRITWDAEKPDGTPRKLLDVSKMASLGWRAGIPLEEGVRRTVDWYISRTGHS